MDPLPLPDLYSGFISSLSQNGPAGTLAHCTDEKTKGFGRLRPRHHLGLNVAVNLCCPRRWPDTPGPQCGGWGQLEHSAPWRQLGGQQELPGWRRGVGPQHPIPPSPSPHPGGLGFSPDRLISQAGRAGADNVFFNPKIL